jgi:hypothetical protein
MQVRLYGSGRWAPGRETAGMSARCLSSASCRCVLCSLRSECAGQGARREVGSEGFEANCRAVAEFTANRSARSRRYRACTTGAKEVLGEPGRNKVFAGGTAGKQHALPREISYGPGPTGLGTWAYKPSAKSPGMPCEKSEWPTVLGNRGRAKAPGPSPRGAAGRRPKRRRSGGRGHAGQGNLRGGSGE